MEMKYYANGELKDEQIIQALKDAAEQYENGEIAEVRDILCEIVNAIDKFEKDY